MEQMGLFFLIENNYQTKRTVPIYLPVYLASRFKRAIRPQIACRSPFLFRVCDNCLMLESAIAVVALVYFAISKYNNKDNNDGGEEYGIFDGKRSG